MKVKAIEEFDSKLPIDEDWHVKIHLVKYNNIVEKVSFAKYIF
jgi:hypothetical protein